MIRTREPSGIVPREQPDNRGLGEATSLGRVMARAADDGQSEAELQRQAQLRREDAQLGIRKTTRALFIDALYRAKALNGDAAFDTDDVDDLDAIEGMAARLGRRRQIRDGASS